MSNYSRNLVVCTCGVYVLVSAMAIHSSGCPSSTTYSSVKKEQSIRQDCPVWIAEKEEHTSETLYDTTIRVGDLRAAGTTLSASPSPSEEF